MLRKRNLFTDKITLAKLVLKLQHRHKAKKLLSKCRRTRNNRANSGIDIKTGLKKLKNTIIF